VDRILRQAIVRQFLRFAAVGFFSTAIHWGVYWFLTTRGLSLQVAYTIGFVLAVTNGFIGNLLWAFKGKHHRAAHTQYLSFVLIQVVGLGIGNAIMTATFHILQHAGYSVQVARYVGLPISTPAITLWGFFANRHWTFAAAEPHAPE
jgi:putative flippase GtrA